MTHRTKGQIAVVGAFFVCCAVAVWFMFLPNADPSNTTSNVQISEAVGSTNVDESGESFEPDKKCGVNEVTLLPPERVAFGLGKEEAVVTVCPNTGSSEFGTHLVDIRSLEGASIQQLSVDSHIHESMFAVRWADIDGDGSLDLLVATEVIGGGPYIAVDAYRFNSTSGHLELDKGISGISWPTIAATPGCIVSEVKNGSDGHYADRYCFDKDTDKWSQPESCKLGEADKAVCHRIYY